MALLISIFFRSLSLVQGEVIFEREISQTALKNFRISTARSYLEPNVSNAELQKIIADAKAGAVFDKSLLKLELLRDADRGGQLYFESTTIIGDLALEKESLDWYRENAPRLTLAQNVGASLSCKHVEGGLLEDSYVFFEDRPRLGVILEEFLGPAKQYVCTYLVDSFDREIDDHQFLRNAIRNECKVERRSFGTVIVTWDRWGKTSQDGKGKGVSWLHGRQLRVKVGALGEVPEDLVEALGKKFPSTIPEGFSIDKTAWGCAEGDYWLSRMEKALEKGDPDQGQSSYASFTSMLQEYIFIPGLGNLDDRAPLPEKKTHFQGLRRWWAENRSKTYWDDSYQMLMAKGNTRRELAQGEAERERRDREELLARPLSDEEIRVARRKLIEQFESEMSQVAESRKKDGLIASFTKEGEQWILSWKDPASPQPVVLSYHGPEIVRLAATKEQPLLARFIKQRLGESEKSARVYSYHRLGDRWEEVDSRQFPAR
jgi:hypothetical protein